MLPSHLRVCLALALWPTLASAQDSPPDTIPFHRHQWAAQFAGGTSFASLGVLRFTAPTRAWLLDFRFTGGHSHDKDYVQATVAFSYERTTQRSSSGAVAKGWAYSGSIQGLSFAATVYF